jgi:hypothetical protein
MINHTTNSNSMIDRITRLGLATPAMALAMLAGAAFAQQGGGSGGAYEVIIDTENAEEAKAHRAAVLSRQEGQDVRTVVEINRMVDGKTISVRRVNDEPIVVKLNGKVLSQDEYTFKDGVVTINAGGNSLELRMPHQIVTSAEENAFAGRMRPVEPAAPAIPGHVRGLAGGEWALAEVAPQPQPKVMLGVVMAEPDPMILEHLGLDIEKAVLLERVVDGLPADKAGLEDKDIIIGFGEKAEPRSADEIRKVLAKAEPGSTVKVKVIRKGHPVTVDLKFEAFDAQALGRATGMTMGAGGVVQPSPQAPRAWGAMQHNQHEQHMKQAEQAMKEAAELLARIEKDIDRSASDAHKQASQAIEKAIAAMKEGEAFGLEVEDMRRMQQEAVERLRSDMGQNQNERRFWAQPDARGEGFALTVPDRQRDDRWADRLEQLEVRLNDLERNLERTMERIENRTEAMMERLMDRLERALEDRDGGRR